MNKLILLLVTIKLFSFSVNEYLKQLNSLTNSQKRIMVETWNKAKQFNLNYTMTAIALKESSFGVIKYNLKDGDVGSFGVFHNLASSVYERYVKNKPKDKNVEVFLKLALGQRLINDFDFAFSQCFAELKYWENIAIIKGKEWDKWRYMIIHYNGGTNASTKESSLNYYREIVKIIKALHIYREHHKKILP